MVLVGFDDEVEQLQQQLEALQSFNEHLRDVERSADSAGSREGQMDRSRALEVLRRTQETLRERLNSAATVDWASADRVRVVVAHRHEWFVAKLTQALDHHEAALVASVSNGADAIGIALAEAPDLVLVDARLEMVTGHEVARSLSRYLPQTKVVGTVNDGGEVAAMLDAGAIAAFTKQVAPEQVVLEALTLLDPEAAAERLSCRISPPLPEEDPEVARPLVRQRRVRTQDLLDRSAAPAAD